MYQNNFYGYTNGGIVPNPNVPTSQDKSWLSPEDQELLMKNPGDKYKINVNSEDVARARCNHKFPQGGIAFFKSEGDDGKQFECSICHKRFNLLDLDKDNVHRITEEFSDLLNTIKVTFIDLPSDTANQFFTMGAFVDNCVEKMTNLSMESFKRYEGINNYFDNSTGNINPMALLGHMSNPNVFGMPQGYGMQQAYNQAQMGYNPQMGQPGFMPQQQVGYNPQMGQPGFMPQQQVGYNPQMMNPLYATNMQQTPPQMGQSGMVNTNMPVQPQQQPTQQTPATQPQQQPTQQNRPTGVEDRK